MTSFLYLSRLCNQWCGYSKGVNYWDFANALAIQTNAPHGKKSIHTQNIVPQKPTSLTLGHNYNQVWGEMMSSMSKLGIKS